MANHRRGNYSERMAGRPAPAVAAQGISEEESEVTAVERYLVDKKEAGIILGLAPVTVSRLGNDGAFPVVRIGARVLYKVDDLRAYADKLAEADVATHRLI